MLLLLIYLLFCYIKKLTHERVDRETNENTRKSGSGVHFAVQLAGVPVALRLRRHVRASCYCASGCERVGDGHGDRTSLYVRAVAVAAWLHLLYTSIRQLHAPHRVSSRDAAILSDPKLAGSHA